MTLTLKRLQTRCKLRVMFPEGVCVLRKIYWQYLMDQIVFLAILIRKVSKLFKGDQLDVSPFFTLRVIHKS